MIYLFLDTTALHLSWRLNGTGWDSIRDGIKLGIATVATSTITVSELERQAGQDAVDVSKNFEQMARDLHRHYVDIVPSPVTFDAEKWRTSFAARLRERGVVVIDRADPSHDVLLERDLARVPPFKQSGDGYRDALIWLTFLGWISRLEFGEDDEVYFVSNNTRQFLDGGRKDALLHPYLREEAHAISKLDVELLPDIEAVVGKVRPLAFIKKQETHQVADVVDETDGEADEDWATAEELALQRARSESSRLLGSSVDDLNLLKEPASRGYTVDGVSFPPIENGEITSIELTGVGEAYQSDVLDGTELWTVDLDASIEIEGALLKQDASEIPEAGAVVDAEWNRHYLMVSFPLSVRLRYDVRVDSAETTDGQLVDVTLLSSDL